VNGILSTVTAVCHIKAIVALKQKKQQSFKYEIAHAVADPLLDVFPSAVVILSFCRAKFGQTKIKRSKYKHIVTERKTESTQLIP